MTLVICVVSQGKKKGKTCLIEALTKKFTGEGFSVSTVKHIHESFDTARKDTWKHLEAGASLTVASTPTEVITITKRVTPLIEESLEAIYRKSDLVFVEGYKKSSKPKILCADTALEVQSAIKEICNIIMVSGYITSKAEEKEKLKTQFPEIKVYNLEELVSSIKNMLVQEIVKSLPGLNCRHCKYDLCLGLAKAVSRGEAVIEDCVVLTTNISMLKVDGKIVQMGEFPQEILRGVILGVLGSLKGVKKHPKDIDIKIKA